MNAMVATTSTSGMNATVNASPGKRKRTKQTLAAPRSVLQKNVKSSAAASVDKLVWVLVGKTEHQAWLLEEITDQQSVPIRWESTGGVERVPVSAVRREFLGRSSRRNRNDSIRYDELPEIDDSLVDVPKKARRNQRNSQCGGGRKRKKPNFAAAAPTAINHSQRSSIQKTNNFIHERVSPSAKASPVPVGKKRAAKPNIPSRKSMASKKSPPSSTKRIDNTQYFMPNYRTIPGTENLDDMELVSRFMSILSRHDDDEEEDDDDPSDSSDEEIEEEVKVEPRKGKFPSVAAEERQDRSSSGNILDGKPSSKVYRFTHSATQNLAESFFREVEDVLHMFNGDTNSEESSNDIAEDIVNDDCESVLSV